MNSFKVNFHGVASHAGVAPEMGRSALDGAVLMDVGVNYLREHVTQEARIHSVITSGGQAPNVVPAYAQIWYFVRAPKRDQVEEIYQRMLDIAKGTGCYTALSKQELGTPLPFDTGQFGTTACFGSFGPGHAPPSSLYELSRVTAVGGYVIFNVVEHCYKELGFIDVMFDITTQGRWQLIEETKPFQPYTNGEPDLFTRIFVFKIVT